MATNDTSKRNSSGANKGIRSNAGNREPRPVKPVGRAARAVNSNEPESKSARRTKSSANSTGSAKKSTGAKASQTSARSKNSAEAAEKKKYEYVSKQEITYEDGLISNELKIIFTGLVSVLLILSYLNICGKVGGYVNYLIFGVFGYFGFAFPFVLFALVFFALRNPGKDVTWQKFLLGTGFVFNVSALVQMSAGGFDESIKWLKYFANSLPSYAGEDKTYGGLAGGIICKLLCPYFGNVAAVCIMVVFAIACLILILGKAILTRIGKSGVGFVKKSRERYRQIKRELERRRLKEAEAEENIDVTPVGKREGSRKSRKDLVEDLMDAPLSEDEKTGAGKRRMRQREVNPVSYDEANVNLVGKKEGFIDNLMRRGMGLDVDGDSEPVPVKTVPPVKNLSEEEAQVEEIRRDIEEYARETSETAEPEDYAESEIRRKFPNRDSSSLATASREFCESEKRLTRITMYDDDTVEEYEQKGSDAIAIFSERRREKFSEGEDSDTTGDTAQQSSACADEASSEEASLDETSSDEASSDAVEFIPVEEDGEAEKKECTEPVKRKRNHFMDAPVFAENNGVRGSSGAKSFTDNTKPATRPERPKPPAYEFPPIELLRGSKANSGSDEASNAETIKARLKDTFESFGVKAEITDYSCGPTVTRFEVKPELGVKVKTITALKDDIKLALAAEEIRIEAPIPGKDAVGIEVPNKEKSPVMFRDMITTDLFKNHKSPLALAIGKDIGGKTQIGDIEKMLHILIAGSTGSGKSVFINTLIMSILFHAKPTDVKLIMVDPKRVELTGYNGIPHLLIPVITDPKKALGALNWAIAEMQERYTKFEDAGVKKIVDFNEQKQKKYEEEGNEGDCPEKLPRIVFIIDELNDLMMTAASKEVEDAIVRLTQLARAAGIYLVIATQRPSVNVITGTIKANIPTRIAFSVSSAIDSRTILDSAGAEALLGNGDMLFAPNGSVKPVRLQGSYISDAEIESVVAFLKDNNKNHKYDENVVAGVDTSTAALDKKAAAEAPAPAKPQDARDELFHDAGRMIIEKQKASIGALQRVFSIGFNRAARIMDQLAEAGVVGPEVGTKPRDIIMNLIQFEQFCGGSGEDAAADMAEAEADSEDIAENAVKSE